MNTVVSGYRILCAGVTHGTHNLICGGMRIISRRMTKAQREEPCCSRGSLFLEWRMGDGEQYEIRDGTKRAKMHRRMSGWVSTQAISPRR